jgi:peptide/nickel transport system substrate-binding protein
MFRRRLLVAVAFFALVAPAWAEERILRVVSPWEVTSLEPSDTGYIAARMEIAETLTQVEPDRRITGGIADSWAVSGGKLTWRFHLALGLNFHDGTPVTAAAVKASFDRCLAGAESLRTVPIASVAADGDSLAVATKTPSRPCRRS